MRCLVVALLTTLACAGATSPTVDFFPLEVGDFWVYDVAFDGSPPEAKRQVLVSDAMGETAQRVYVVSEVDESLAPEDRADQPTTYQRGAEGIFCLECESILVPSAPMVGQSWSAGTAAGGESRTIEIGAKIATERFQFSDCLVIERREPVQKRRIELTFAPGVGLVRARFFAEGSESSRPYREEVLSEYGTIRPARFPYPAE